MERALRGMRGVDPVRNTLLRLMRGIAGPGRRIRVILLYHSVGSDVSPASIPVKAFATQMELVARRFKTVRLGDLRSATRSGHPSEENIACVTFDDGYADNFEHALPVLEQCGIKATFFVVSGFLGKTCPTFAGPIPMMEAGQVRELAAMGHEIGSHTVSHRLLAALPHRTATMEMELSKKTLEDMLGEEVSSLAYPKGSYDRGMEETAERLGYRTAATTREGLVEPRPDWMALPRVWIGNRLNMGAFEAKLSPAIDWYVQLRSACVRVWHSS